MVKATIIAMIMACQYVLNPQFSTQWRMDNPQIVKEAEVTIEEPQSSAESEWVSVDYSTWYIPSYYDMTIEKHPVLVECEAWELETLIRTMYLEAGAEEGYFKCSDEALRAVTEATFNQLNSGLFGNTLGEVLYRQGNFDETVPYAWTVEPSQRARDIVMDVYENGISLPSRIIVFRNQYFHGSWWTYPEFMIDNIYFSSSIYYQP